MDANPGLGNLAENQGNVKTASIQSGSSAHNKGVYVRRAVDNNNNNSETYYYSTNSTDDSSWFTLREAATQGLDIGDKVYEGRPPAGAEDLTATDATGYQRTDGRPDIGAYEYRPQ